MKMIAPFLFAIVIPLIFFAKLFIPEPSIYVTPDFAASDIWNFNYPLKDFLSQSLKHGELPFWSKGIATGSPVFAEGVIGSLYGFNLLFFGFLPTSLAWNLSYPVHLFLALLGSYFFFRNLGLKPAACYFSAFSYSFGGFFITHLQHLSPVQAAALMPWIFLTADRVWIKASKTNILLFAFLVSQQIFTGFVQASFITLVGVMLMLVARRRERSITTFLKKIGLISIALVLAFALAAPQILPTMEFKDLSARSQGLSQAEIFQYPYRIKQLVTMLVPNAFGTPKDGSFPSPFSDQSMGIYWENTVYMGILPVVFACFALFHTRKKRWERSFLFLAVISILLVLGRSSPLAFIYTYPGFNYFRVPSRFLLLTSFFLAAIAGVGFEMVVDFIKRQKRLARFASTLPVGLLLLGMGDVFLFSYSYQPSVPVSQALEPPQSLRFIGTEGRIYTDTSQGGSWNEVFFDRGWEHPSEYLYLKNGLDANLNLLFSKDQVLARSAFPTLRQSFQRRSLPLLLNTTAARYIVSTAELKQGEVLKSLGTVEPPATNLPSYHIYENTQSLARFRLVSKYVVPRSLDDLNSVFENDEFSFATTALLEKDPGEEFGELNQAEITVEEDLNRRLVLTTHTDKRSLLVVGDSFYPGWTAQINGSPVEIFAANVNQRAVAVPSGENQIVMTYSPSTFFRGVTVALVAFVSYFVFFWVRGLTRMGPPSERRRMRGHD